MYITPKKRLMSITNALATQKYIAYSTEIDLEKAKVEDDGTILAGSPYPFSSGGNLGGGGGDIPPEEQGPLYPYRNYIFDSAYEVSEFIEAFNNPGGTYRNVYFDKFSLIHNITGGLTTSFAVEKENTKVIVQLFNSYNQNPIVYHFYIMHDLVEPIDLSKTWNLSGEITSNLQINNFSAFFSTTNTRGNKSGSFTTSELSKTIGVPNLSLNVNYTWDKEASPGTLAYAICFGFQGNIRPQNRIEINFKKMMLTEGSSPVPYYPAEEDLQPHIQTARSISNMSESIVMPDGLIFNDINVKEELKSGIKAVTGKIITSGYVLESRLPYPLTNEAKDHLKMIRFR